MFVEINPPYIVSVLFFLTSISYLYLSVVTMVGNAEVRIRRRYLAASVSLILYSLCYGFMTISESVMLRQIFWAVGFTSGFMFFPFWLLFLHNVVKFKHKISKQLIKASLFITAAVAILCVLSNDFDLRMTGYGIQFSYQNSAMFVVAVIYAFIITIPVVILQFRWWREAELQRHRKMASAFIFIALMATSIGFITDFFIPVFTDKTAIPLGSVTILAASIMTYSRMLSNKALRITVQNVSGYTFSSVEIPILVLDTQNIIGLENKAAAHFFGVSLLGKNISEVVRLDNKPPNQSFFVNSFASEIISAETPSGVRICDMLLTVERDKLGDAICKVAIIRDITESMYKDSLLEAVNRLSGTLLEPDTSNFEINLYMAMGMMAKAVDAHRVYIWKNHTINEDLYCTQVYQWSESSEEQQNNDASVTVPYREIMIDLEERLSSGECINGIVKAILPENGSNLTAQDILSILIVPVFMHDHFWGFVRFDDCYKERIFTENEELILRSASRMIANSIIRNEMTKQLESALTDELTGARNRRYFMELADKELMKCINEELPYSLIMIDADFFKEINDTYGHPVGDEVLKILVARISHTLKRDTLVSRYGGDEFVVSLPDTGPENIILTAERIRSNIEDNAFKIGDIELRVTASLGIGSLTTRSKTLAEIISDADKALYQAKQSGRNKVVNFKPES